MKPKATAHYQQHRADPGYLQRRRRYARAYRQQHDDDPRRHLFDRALQVGCATCGERNAECLDMHRLADPRRPLTLRQAKRLDVAALEREIATCVCLCANCRRRHLAGNLGLPHWVPEESRWL